MVLSPFDVAADLQACYKFVHLALILENCNVKKITAVIVLFDSVVVVYDVLSGSHVGHNVKAFHV
jgi:hypothetical protein